MNRNTAGGGRIRPPFFMDFLEEMESEEMKEVRILADCSWYGRVHRAGERAVVGEDEFWDLIKFQRAELCDTSTVEMEEAVRMHDEKSRPIEGRHSGEIIAVLGNGPGLLDSPTEDLRRITTIGVNRVPLHHDPDYLLWLDVKFQSECSELIARSGAEKFAAEKIRLPHPYHRFGKYVPRSGEPMMSDSFEKGLYWSQTSVFPAINLAVMFGAAGIVLAGVDLADGSHFYSRDGADAEFPGAMRILADMRKFADYAAAAGIEVWNASSGGAVDFFPRGRLGEIIERMAQSGKLLKRR